MPLLLVHLVVSSCSVTFGGIAGVLLRPTEGRSMGLIINTTMSESQVEGIFKTDIFFIHLSIISIINIEVKIYPCR